MTCSDDFIQQSDWYCQIQVLEFDGSCSECYQALSSISPYFKEGTWDLGYTRSVMNCASWYQILA